MYQAKLIPACETEYNHPVYYKTCNRIGKEILIKAQFLDDLNYYESVFEREAIEVIREVEKLNHTAYSYLNVLKYLWRVGNREDRSVNLDLNKALWYCHDTIDNYPRISQTIRLSAEKIKTVLIKELQPA